MRLLESSVGCVCVLGGLCALGLGGKDHHDGGKKHSYGVGYVEEGGVVGYSCHEGWVPQGEGPGMICVQKVKTNLMPVCPFGSLQGHECVLSEPALFSCPPGYIEVGGAGGKKDHHGHGGKKHHGGGEPLCMQVERAPLVPYCPPGSDLAHGQCGRSEIAPATMICPLESGGHKHHGEGGKKKGHYAAPACVETIDVPPMLTCPPNLVLEGGMCHGTGQGPCPQNLPPPVLLEGGKGKHGGHGRALAQIPEAPLRELGKKKHGHEELYAAPILAPVPSKVKMCNLDIYEPAVPVCPPGSFESGNFGHHDKKKHGGSHGNAGLRCAQTVDVPLEPYCPMPGAILDAKTMTCQSHMNEQVRTRCPAGFDPCDSGKKDHGGKKHNGGKKHGHGHGSYAAPDCCAAHYAPPLPGCPMGAQLTGGQCVVLHEPLFECPPGAVRDGEFCYLITTKPPKIHYQINVTTKQSKQAPPPLDSGKKHKHHKHH